MDETKRWSEGVVGFGSGSVVDLIERMRLDIGLGVMVASDPHHTPVPAEPEFSGLNRRQRRELARRSRRR